MQKAPEHCCYRALETPPPAVGQAMNDSVAYLGAIMHYFVNRRK